MIKKALNNSQDKYSINDLIDVMRALRTPITGCPWDLEQDFASIAPYTIEEAYEVVDAIDRKDIKDLREELGDLLLQPIYHAQMASEEGFFSIEDVIHDVTTKMIFRHPHVFGDGSANSAEDVDKIWDERKKAEKANQESALDGVTKSLPSLLRAQKLQKKAAKVGFEWPSTEEILDKLEEEIAELRDAIDNKDEKNQAEEFGDILFVLSNYARKIGINAEESLRKANQKFERRFRGLENSFKYADKDLEKCSLEEMIAAWNAEKKKEKEKRERKNIKKKLKRKLS